MESGSGLGRAREDTGTLSTQPASHRPTPIPALGVSLMPLLPEHKVPIRVGMDSDPEPDSSRYFLQKNADFRVTYDPAGTLPGQLTCCSSLSKGSLGSSYLGAIQSKN